MSASVFRSHTPPEAIDLLTKQLRYPPEQRFSPIESCTQPFFEELRDPSTRLPNGKPLPNLFDFQPDELKTLSQTHTEKLIPPQAQGR